MAIASGFQWSVASCYCRNLPDFQGHSLREFFPMLVCSNIDKMCSNIGKIERNCARIFEIYFQYGVAMLPLSIVGKVIVFGGSIAFQYLRI